MLHRHRKHFCRYFLRSFYSAQTLERNVNDCFEASGKQLIKMAKKGETVKIKNYTRKIKSPFKVYADFESILAHENKIMECTIQMRLIRINIKIMLVEVLVII